MLELITAVVKPHKLDDIRTALLANGVEGMTVTEVRGFGRQRGRTEVFRGSEYNVDFIPKIKVEIVVASEVADRIVQAITDAAHTGKIGDGKIWRVDVSSLLRVRTGEQGNDAL
jgi:nitrogen regulatory protein P-II 1